MNGNIEFENGLYGLRAVIKTHWSEVYLNELKSKNISEIELNTGKGWRSGNIDFLKSFPSLKSIIILDGALQSLTPLHCLTELISMNISTYSKTPIDFANFPNLTKCGFEWIKGSDSLFECSNLIALSLNRYDKQKSDVFSKLINLEKLTILNSNIENIDGLSRLNNLKYLSIANLKKLTSLQGLQYLHELEEFEIQRCKGIFTISEVLQLNKLKRLLLIDLGDIASIRGIENLTELKEFLFYESTNIIDGDLLPITKLNSLKKISYQNRKHYSHKREDFGRQYTG